MPFIPDQVGGQKPGAEWANDVRDQLVTPFDDTSDRDAAIPSPDPGRLVYVASGDAAEGLYARTSAGRWGKPWNLPWGMDPTDDSVVAQSTSASTTYVDTGLEVTTAVYPARRILRWWIDFHMLATASGDILRVALRSPGNAVLKARDFFIASTAFADSRLVVFTEETTGVAALTRKVSIHRVAGTGTVRFFADVDRPAVLSVEDAGPAGAPG